MRKTFPLAVCVFLGFLFCSILCIYSVKSATRPDWIPEDWVQLTTSSNNENSPSWSLDGKEILYWANDGGWDRDVWVMNADGTDKRKLTDLGVTEHPDFSPDGTKIAFSHYVGNDYFHLATINSDGSNLTYIYTEGSSQIPDWSPNGDKIVFHRTVSGPFPPYQIFVINADGTNPVQLTTQGSNACPSWSPDGTKIAFSSNRDGQWEIYTMNSDGTNQKRLTYIGGDRVTWSPDGSHVSFMSDNEGQRDLYMIKTDGTNIVRLSETAADEIDHEWSPDGKWIALQEQVNGEWDIYKFPAPYASATINIDPDTLNLKSKGQWVTAYIELPERYNMSDIDITTITLNSTIAAETLPKGIGDEDGDDIPDLMVKFDWALVISFIESNIEWSTPERTMPLIYAVNLTVTGNLDDGTPFKGTDTIRALKFLKAQPQPK